MAKRSRGRELIDTGRDKRFVRRDERGQFKESDDVGRSLSKDCRDIERKQCADVGARQARCSGSDK